MAASLPTVKLVLARPIRLQAIQRTQSTWVGWSQLGIIPRTFKHLFEDIKAQCYDKYDFTIKIAIVEIYNDKVFDLLQDIPDEEVKIKGSGLAGGITAAHRSDPFYMKGVTELSVGTLKDAMYLLEISKNNRSKILETNSSRSHFILNLSVTQENTVTKITKVGDMSFVDLVACERITDSRLCLSGPELSENKTINKGLTYLNSCIENLAKGLKGDFRSCNLTK